MTQVMGANRRVADLGHGFGVPSGTEDSMSRPCSGGIPIGAPVESGFAITGLWEQVGLVGLAAFLVFMFQLVRTRLQGFVMLSLRDCWSRLSQRTWERQRLLHWWHGVVRVAHDRVGERAGCWRGRRGSQPGAAPPGMRCAKTRGWSGVPNERVQARTTGAVLATLPGRRGRPEPR